MQESENSSIAINTYFKNNFCFAHGIEETNLSNLIFERVLSYAINWKKNNYFREENICF